MSHCLWIVSISNEHDAIVFFPTVMNCQVLSMEVRVVVVWLSQTYTMRLSVFLTHGKLIQKVKVCCQDEDNQNGSQMGLSGLSHSNKTLQPALSVQRDTGCGLYAEGGPGRHTLLIQGPPQCVCAWGVWGEWRHERVRHLQAARICVY